MLRPAATAALAVAFMWALPAQAGLLPFDPFNPATFGSNNSAQLIGNATGGVITSGLGSVLNLTSTGLLLFDLQSPDTGGSPFGGPPQSPNSNHNDANSDGQPNNPLPSFFTTPTVNGFNFGNDGGSSAAVPEPAGAALLGGAVLSLALLRGRRRG
jgi:hypothetical protein